MRAPGEARLIERMQAGDSQAVSELAATYGPKVHQLALRFLKNHEDAEEITQDVLLKVWKRIGAFRGDAALSSWIYRITFNTAMSRLRVHRFRRPNEVSDEIVSAGDPEKRRPRVREIADWSSLADDEVMRGELRKKLLDAMMELPQIYRVPVLLRDIQGLSTEEASAVLRVNTQTLKSRLHRGRLILREKLGDFAGGLSLHRAA